MHILFLPSWYNSDDNPDDNNFITNQMKGVEMAGAKVGVVFVRNTIYDRPFSKMYSRKVRTFNGINEVRVETLLPSLKGKLGLKLIPLIWLSAYNQYCKAYGKPDLIHAHGYPAAIYATSIKEKAQKPVVVTEQSQDLVLKNLSYSLKLAITEAYSRASSLVSIGQFLKKHMKVFTTKDINIIPNCIDLDLFYPKQNSSNTKRESTFKIVVSSYLLKRKKVDLAILAIGILKKKNLDVHLSIIGDGPEMSNLKKLTKELDLDDYITFKGLILNRHLPIELWRADAMLITCPTETFCVAAIEGLACGLPLIIPNSGEPQYFIPKSFCEISENTPLGISTAIELVIKNYDKYNDENNLQEVLSTSFRYSLSSISQRYVQDVYLPLLRKL